jgi:hypothetical protein
MNYLYDHHFFDLAAQVSKFLVQILILLYLMKIHRKMDEKR